MKRIAFLSLFILAIALSGFSQETPLLTRLTEPYAVPTGVDEMAVLNDLAGGFYVVYTEAGRLHVLKGAGDGTLAPYAVEFYGKTITDIHSLTTNPMGPGQFGCFVGTENGVERLFFFGVDYEAKFVFFRDPIDDENTDGTIRQVEISARDSFVADVYYIKGDDLFVANTSLFSDRPVVLEKISRLGESIIDYGITKIRRDSLVRELGWYRVQDSFEKRKVTRFSKSEDDIFQLEDLGSFSDAVRIFFLQNATLETLYWIIDGQTVMSFSVGDFGSIKRSEFTAPGFVKDYYEIDDNSSCVGILTCTNNAGEMVYLVENPHSPSPQFMPLLSAPCDSVNNLVKTDLSHLLIIYKNADGWYSADLDFRTYSVSVSRITSDGDEAVLVYEGLSSRPQALLFAGRESRALTVMTYDNLSWTAAETFFLTELTSIAVDHLELEAVPYLSPLLWGLDIFPFDVPAGSLFFSEKRRNAEYLAHKKKVWSTTNGLALIGIFEDDEISVYQIEEKK